MAYKKSKAEWSEDARWKRIQAKRRKKRKSKVVAPKKQPQRKSPTKNSTDKYKTPEWQELRERILRRDEFRCVGCAVKDVPLAVHHLLYDKHKEIWEVPDWYLVTLCKRCHAKEHVISHSLPRNFFRD